MLSGEQAAVEAAVAVLEDDHYVVPTIIERQVAHRVPDRERSRGHPAAGADLTECQ